MASLWPFADPGRAPYSTRVTTFRLVVDPATDTLALHSEDINAAATFLVYPLADRECQQDPRSGVRAGRAVVGGAERSPYLVRPLRLGIGAIRLLTVTSGYRGIAVDRGTAAAYPGEKEPGSN